MWHLSAFSLKLCLSSITTFCAGQLSQIVLLRYPFPAPNSTNTLSAASCIPKGFAHSIVSDFGKTCSQCRHSGEGIVGVQ